MCLGSKDYLLKSNIRLNDLKPIVDLKDNIALKNLNITYKEIVQGITLLQINKKDVYYVYDKQLNTITYFYYNNFVFYTISSFNVEHIETYKLLEYIKSVEHSVETWIKNNQYMHIFSNIPPIIAMDIFLKNIDTIPEEQRLNIFDNLYIRNLDLQDVNYTELQKVQSLFQKSIILPKDIQEDEQGYIKIYWGGENLYSLGLAKYTWSYSKVVAFCRASRLVHGKIYSAKVKKDDIIFYTNTLCTKDFLVNQDNLIDLKKETYYTVSYYTKYINENKHILREYKKLVCTWDYLLLFGKNKGKHDANHSKRVTLLSLLLADFDSLSKQDKTILKYAAMYHDIGRKNDKICIEHGKQSIDKVKELKLVSFKDLEDWLIFKFIVECHCVPDTEAYALLKNTKIKDKERAKRLYNYLCDADNLDRVRLGDLDESYLRNEESKKLGLLAYYLLSNTI